MRILSTIVLEPCGEPDNRPSSIYLPFALDVFPATAVAFQSTANFLFADCTPRLLYIPAHACIINLLSFCIFFSHLIITIPPKRSDAGSLRLYFSASSELFLWRLRVLAPFYFRSPVAGLSSKNDSLTGPGHRNLGRFLGFDVDPKSGAIKKLIKCSPES